MGWPSPGWGWAALFGLVHGFGFAGALSAFSLPEGAELPALPNAFFAAPTRRARVEALTRKLREQAQEAGAGT